MAKLSEIESTEFIVELSSYLNSNIIKNIKETASKNDDSDNYLSLKSLEDKIDKLKEDYSKNREQYNYTKTKQANSEHNKDFLSGQRKILNEQGKIITQEIKILEEEKKSIEERKKSDAEHISVVNKVSEQQIKTEQTLSQLQKERYEYRKKLEEELYKKETERLREINKREEEASIIKEEYRIKGYNKKNGKKNSGAEIFNKIGDIKSLFKTESLGRIIGKTTAESLKVGGNTLGMISSGKMDVNAIASKVSSGLSSLGPWGMAGGAVIDIFAKLFEMYSKVNTEASKYARIVGGGSYAMKRMEKETAELADRMTKLWGRSYDAAELIKTMSEYSTVLGRNVEHFSDLDKIELFNLKEMGISNETISQMDTFGISVSETSNRLNKVYQESGKKGLNAKAVTDQIQKNLKLAQKYTFAGGLKALTRMAEKATALKVDMSLASSFADKVSTLEGAATTGAELSVLGGSYAQVGNPLSLLYGGLQDAEKLFEDFVKMASDKAFYNKETGEYEISAFERQRMKYASNSTGINYDDFLNATMRNAQLRDIDNAISKNYTGIDEETREYIRNIAVIKNGKPVVSLKTGIDENGHDIYEDKDISNLTPLEKEALRKESEAKYNKENGTIGDVLNSTRSTQDKLNDIIGLLKNQIVRALFKIAEMDYNEEFALNEENTEKYKEGKKNAWFRAYLAMAGLKTNSEGDLKFDYKDFLKSYFNPYIKYNNMVESFNNTDKYNYNLASNLSKSELSQGHALGGPITGNGNSTSDSIPAMLSNGEFVINAKNAQANYSVLNAINNGNGESYFKQMKVEPIRESTLSKPQTMEISLKPLQINVGGEFNVKSNGQNLGNINAKDLFTQEVLAELSRQLAKTLNHGVLDTETSQKLKFV